MIIVFDEERIQIKVSQEKMQIEHPGGSKCRTLVSFCISAVPGLGRPCREDGQEFEISLVYV